MKELSVEQKAKAYDGLIERLKDLKFAYRFSPLSDTIEEKFPELKESGDENIRKAAIEFVRQNKSFHYSLGISKEQVLAWLEKQGEQKHANKVKTKFKVGDWITNGDYTWKIVEVKPLDYILQSQDGNIVDDTIAHVDEHFHSFTIEDAKDGDVLASEDKNKAFIYNGKLDLRGRVCAYCGIYKTYDGLRFTECAIGNYFTYKEPHPATKEQRDTLMKAMADAGYTFDFDKKELKKVEQNPAWSEEDETVLNNLIYALANDRIGNDRDEYISWLKSLKPQKQWKPSEEQMDALEHFVRSIGESGYTSPYDNNTKLLYSLLEQLKKLRKE